MTFCTAARRVDDCFGEEGDDTFKLTGSDLGDNVYGGEGSDVLDLSGWTKPNVGFLVNLASLFYRYQPNASGADGIYDLSGIEHVRGSNFSDTISGDAQANIIVGGGGIDSMAGAAGDDRYYVDDPNDNIIELAGAGTGFDTIFASVSYTMGPNVERIYLIGDFGRAAYGRDGENDYLYGNSRENILDGKFGADYMSGGIGSDTYYVNTSGDVVYEAPGGLAGTSDTIFARTSYTMPANVEGLYLLGGGNYNANGRNGKLDYLYGNSGNNILNGLSGERLYDGWPGR